MPKSGSIVIIEDDIDDQEVIKEVIKELNISNEVILFSSTSEAFQFLKTAIKQPFLIICDINLPVANGLDFKKQIDNDPQLKQKSIPFIFFSTVANKQLVTKAYTEMTVQGFFEKPSNMEDIKKAVFIINEYWKLCKHPNCIE